MRHGSGMCTVDVRDSIIIDFPLQIYWPLLDKNIWQDCIDLSARDLALAKQAQHWQQGEFWTRNSPPTGTGHYEFLPNQPPSTSLSSSVLTLHQSAHSLTLVRMSSACPRGQPWAYPGDHKMNRAVPWSDFSQKKISIIYIMGLAKNDLGLEMIMEIQFCCAHT